MLHLDRSFTVIGAPQLGTLRLADRSETCVGGPYHHSALVAFVPSCITGFGQDFDIAVEHIFLSFELALETVFYTN